MHVEKKVSCFGILLSPSESESSTVQPHYNAPHYCAVTALFNITCQNDYFARKHYTLPSPAKMKFQGDILFSRLSMRPLVHNTFVSLISCYMGCAGVYNLIFDPKHRLWVVLELPQSMF